jgi:hypothetical protein
MMENAMAIENSGAIGKSGGVGAQDPVDRIEETRAALRDAAGVNDGPQAFPRSQVLQLALSPRYRWITAAVATAGAIALWRRLPGRRVGLLLGAVSLARRMREHR